MKTPYFKKDIQVTMTLNDLGKIIEVVNHDLEAIAECKEVPEGLRRMYIQEMSDIQKRLNHQYKTAFKAQAKEVRG